jgi:hypothetical protein
MIVDTLAARSRNLREMIRKAQIIRVPFPVVCTDQEGAIDWKADRIPAHLSLTLPDTSRDASDFRLPYPTMVFASTSAEQGIVLVWESTDQPHTFSAGVTPVAQAMLIWHDPEDVNVYPLHLGIKDDRLCLSSIESGVSVLGSAVPEWLAPQKARLADPTFQYDLLNAYYHYYWQANEWVNDRPIRSAQDVRNLRRGLAGDFREWAARAILHTADTILTAVTLLNTKNIVARPVDPPPRLQQAREAAGKLPLYRYHVLVVRPFATERETSLSAGTGLPVGIHWRRGHWKRYTEAAPMLGKHIGRFWFNRTLAGHARRIVDKDYQIDTDPPQTASSADSMP